MTEEESAKVASLADKPMLVYVQSEESGNKVTRELESVVFPNENVAVGSKFFDCIRVTTGDALQDRLLKEAGRYTPRIVLVNREYEVVDVLQKKGVSSGKLLRSMKRLVRREYKTSFDRMVRGYIRLLNDLDRLDSRRARLADDRARIAGERNPYKRKKLERDEKEIEEDMRDWEKKEKKLLELRPRRPKGIDS